MSEKVSEKVSETLAIFYSFKKLVNNSKRMDELMDGWMAECTNGQMDEKMDESNGPMNGWADGSMNGWADGLMNGWADGSMNGWIYTERDIQDRCNT